MTTWMKDRVLLEEWEGSFYGRAVSVSNNWLVVGVPSRDSPEFGAGQTCDGVEKRCSSECNGRRDDAGWNGHR